MSILDVIQSFLERELIPVIQSTVNHGMREIQLNAHHFSVIRDIDGSGGGSGAGNMGDSSAAQRRGAGGGGGGGMSGSGDVHSVVPLCYAAQLCCTASKPLFSYWLQLHQHRSMVCTVLDRLIRGYASAAREEFEALTYNCLTAGGGSGGSGNNNNNKSGGNGKDAHAGNAGCADTKHQT